MPQNFSNINFIIGNEIVLHKINKAKILPLFSDLILQFLSELSNRLLANTKAKDFVDVMSYAFWIRKASIEKERKRYKTDSKIGRGVAFHIAPSNVPVAFAMSMTAALLAGNACIVKVSNKEYEQVNIICSTINDIISSSIPEMSNYLVVIRYEHDETITQSLTDLCDIRVIWGGDRTVNTIRNTILPSRAIELTFADRYSLAIINSDKYLDSDYNKIAKEFYADTYFIDQNACSSPRLVVWTGENIEKSKEIFWKHLEVLIDKDYNLQPVKVVDKLDSFCKLAAFNKGVKIIKEKNTLYRASVKNLTENIMDLKDNCGYFFEYNAKNLKEIVPVLSKKCQTISYFGVNPEEIKRIIIENGVKGADRVVPIGQTMELTLVWDGFDLVDTMSRIINIK